MKTLKESLMDFNGVIYSLNINDIQLNANVTLLKISEKKISIQENIAKLKEASRLLDDVYNAYTLELEKHRDSH